MNTDNNLIKGIIKGFLTVFLGGTAVVLGNEAKKNFLNSKTLNSTKKS